MPSADFYNNPGIIDPRVDYVYRGFLLRPPSFMEVAFDNLSYVEYQVSVSEDASFWGDWEDLVTARRASKFNYIHGDLLSTIYYRYRARYTFTDTSQTDWSDYNISGAGGTDPSASKIDETAASLGTITSGYMRGVVFETSATAPKVRMDPSGFYSIGYSSTPVAILAGGNATFRGQMTADLGLKMLAGDDGSDNAVPSSIARVDWSTPVDSATPTVSLYGWNDGQSQGAALQVLSGPIDTYPSTGAPTRASYLNFYNKNVLGVKRANISVGTISGSSESSVELLGSDGQSGFVRVANGSTRLTRLACGTATLSWTASSDSASTTVNHSLGVTPTSITATSQTALGFGTIPLCNVHTINSTSFDINARTADGGAITANQVVSWIAMYQA